MATKVTTFLILPRGSGLSHVRRFAGIASILGLTACGSSANIENVKPNLVDRNHAQTSYLVRYYSASRCEVFEQTLALTPEPGGIHISIGDRDSHESTTAFDPEKCSRFWTIMESIGLKVPISKYRPVSDHTIHILGPDEKPDITSNCGIGIWKGSDESKRDVYSYHLELFRGEVTFYISGKSTYTPVNITDDDRRRAIEGFASLMNQDVPTLCGPVLVRD